MAGSEFKDAAKDFGRHEEAGGIVGSIDVDRAGVGANERFKSGEIVSPSVFGFAAPFADGGAGAAGKGESAFVAGSFDDGVILGSEERVIEEEDGFFGGGSDNELVGMNFGVDGGEGFAEPGSAGRFGVAAPVFKECVVGAGFEREKIGDGLGFGVGGGEEVLSGKFVFAQIFLDAEGRDLHGEEFAKRWEGSLGPN